MYVTGCVIGRICQVGNDEIADISTIERGAGVYRIMQL